MSSTVQFDLRLQRNGFDLHVCAQLPSPGITVLFGPSGSGKTTVLRCLAGLERAQGNVHVNDSVWQNDLQGVFVPTWQRNLGYVFQEASLFEHLNVHGNLLFGLNQLSRTQRTARQQSALQDAIALLGIEHLLTRSVQELSGGERQRVAIARALALQPQVLLLDEPLAALDSARKQEILPWLERLRSDLQIPMVYVTHSTDELARLADHVLILQAGRLLTEGPLNTVLTHPQVTQQLAEEACVVWAGQVVELDDTYFLARLQCPGGSVWVRSTGLTLGQQARVRIQARQVSLSDAVPTHTSLQNFICGTVRCMHTGGHPSQVCVEVNCNGVPLLAGITQRAVDQLQLKVGRPVWCAIKSVGLIE